MFRLVTLFALLSVTVRAVDFTCPQTAITAPSAGNLPPGATTTTTVPKGTNCTYTFNIPDGYALQLKLSALFQSDLDKVAVIDNLGMSRNLVHKKTQTNDALLYVSAGTAQIKVVGDSGQSTFLAKYQFINLNTYVQIKKSTGQFFPLSQVSGINYVTITSDKKDRVIATVAKGNSQAVDPVLENIYVYDGDNIKSAKMIGRLVDLGSQNVNSSSGSSLTLVNFYNTKSDNYILGNDRKAVIDYWKYTVFFTSKGRYIQGSLTDGSTYGSGYTIVCLDCNELYFTKLQFDSLRTFNNGFVTIQGLSPTHQLQKLINYSSMKTTSDYFPQNIQANMFTMVVKMSGVNIRVTTTKDNADYQTPFDGRTGYIFSPNLWDPSNMNSFSLEIRNDSTLYNYQMSFDKVNFGTNQDKLNLQIGQKSGNPSVNNQYSQTSTASGKVTGKGNYMLVSYGGSSSSDVRLSYSMEKSSVGTISVLMALTVTLLNLIR